MGFRRILVTIKGVHGLLDAIVPILGWDDYVININTGQNPISDCVSRLIVSYS